MAKVLAGEANAFEKEEFERWIEKSPQNREIFEKLRYVWGNWFAPNPENTPSFDEFWKNLTIEISLDNSIGSDVIEKDLSTDQPDKLKKIFNFHNFAIAAALLIFISSIFIFKNWDNIFSVETYKTKYTEKLSIMLPDGSHVQLNSDSQIQFHKSFSDSVRSVTLSGQAYFDVIKENCPFIVNTSNATIQVEGTSFDIENRDNKTRVIVKHGSVRFSSNNPLSEGKVLLKANEMSYCINSHEPSKPVIVDVELLTGWLKNILVFDKTPLSEIVAELQRYYGIKIELAEGNNLDNLELSGEFSNRPAEEVVSLICLALDLNYEYDDKTIVISR